MSGLFGSPRTPNNASISHISASHSGVGAGTPLTSKKRVERRTTKIREIEEHLRKGGVSFPFGAARAIVDNDYESIEDILRLNDEQLVQLLIMAGVKHKSIVTFTHYCSGLRPSKLGVKNTNDNENHKPLSPTTSGSLMFETPKQSLRDLSDDMANTSTDEPGSSFYEMEKKYAIGPEGMMSAELPLDTFSEVTNSLNVLMLNAKKSYDEAEDEYRSALRTNESFEWAHNNLGMLLMNVRNDYDGAEREFRRAIELDNTYAWPRNNLGLLLFEIREEYAAAEIEFRACIDLEPGHREAHSNLATLLNAKAIKLELKRDASTAAAIYMEAADHWECRHGKHNNYSREARTKASHLMGMGK